MKKPRIAILGFGEIGSVLFPLFKKQKYHVEAWDKLPGKVSNQKSLFEIIPQADIIFLCIPSWHLESAIKSIRPFVHKQTIIASFSKGLQKTKETPFTFLSQNFQNNDIVVIGGAMLAEEVGLGMPGIAVIAGNRNESRELVCNCFKNTSIVCFKANDPEACSYSSVLKNVYALGLGIAGGIGWGGNARALIAREALFEMERIAKILHIKRDLIYGPPGFVDLIATGFSEYSKNVEVGKLVVSSKKTIPLSEGFVSLEPLKRILGVSYKDFPLFSVIYDSVQKREMAKALFSRFLGRIEKRG